MRRIRRKKNPSKKIGLTLATIMTAGALFCAGFIFVPFGKDTVPESKAMETNDNYSAPEHKEQTMQYEIVTPDESTLNQQERKSSISASKQSGLEKAVDDLIVLTEGDE
ncbi:hypothetical protein bpr_IV077 (plasmid) [Butyrivibrio proteoclasticus B316]|uniref:Uncharacterized protein n=1 Tax=Butyrivibrio proteoclasticus (strain ATCC 51982 / DSM 14932 / B316) TaxID=515622 RepID=E0S4W0_BUTPB|nr:hypothetical protein [Butyrivibrio proteoclasticus]ADL36442.1 hypothetical protein bpr_IV077 [Butyrivibrio proteoclasticus B316]